MPRTKHCTKNYYWSLSNCSQHCIGNMARRRIYSQLFVRYSALVPADEYCRETELTMRFFIFNLRAVGRSAAAPGRRDSISPPAQSPARWAQFNEQLKSLKYLQMRYQVYVIELSKRVFTENTKFRLANPQFNGVLQCLYVGMTSKTPAERFKQHKTGYVNKKGHKLSANIVQKYGSYLRPSLYNHINLKAMTRQEALLMEEKLAMDLRRQGYAVWFN